MSPEDAEGEPANPYDVETNSHREWLTAEGFDTSSTPLVFQERAVNLADLSTGRRGEEYDADTHPIISVLMTEGPIGLTRIPPASGFALREDGYVDKCHLCQEIRTYLSSHFPEILRPDNYYPPIESSA